MLRNVRRRRERLAGSAALCRRIVRSLTRAPDGEATLGWLAECLQRPAVDLAAPLARLVEAGKIYTWRIHRGNPPKVVGVGISLVVDPEAPLKGKAWARLALATDLTTGHAPNGDRGHREFDGRTGLPLDGPTLAELPKLRVEADGRETWEDPDPPPTQAERDRQLIERWLAPEGDYALLAAEPIVPDGVPYPTLWLGTGVAWHRPRPEELCIGCHSTPRLPRGAYCLVCDAFGAGMDLTGTGPVEERPKERGKKVKTKGRAAS